MNVPQDRNVATDSDEDLEDWLFEHDPQVIREAQESVERLKQGKGISLDDLRRELGV